MECDEYYKKFQEIEGWEKLSDGRDAFVLNSLSFLILNKLFLL
jgi:hypothetical protein